MPGVFYLGVFRRGKDFLSSKMIFEQEKTRSIKNRKLFCDGAVVNGRKVLGVNRKNLDDKNRKLFCDGAVVNGRKVLGVNRKNLDDKNRKLFCGRVVSE